MKRKAKIVFTTKVNDTVFILLGQRTTTEATFWWLPGGSVDAGESDAAAVMRELSEELILPAAYHQAVLKHLVESETSTIEYQGKAYVILFKVVLHPTDQFPLPEIVDEFDSLQWFSIDALPQNMSREFDPIADRFVQWITSID
ncbi:MAG: NUDIX hydrolase [Cytophagaceae bacterium]|jgi:8-oxo-dGTP pyrophosphatase MutT (NUDIX family)|nr:NUDIX hydrolase [Cytophagaceae bacterium]